jgi:deoxyribonuclease-4
MIKLGSHVGMSGKEMLLGSAKEAAGYGADTFMIYTGAPQNTRRKSIEQLNIEEGLKYMKEHNLSDLIVHAPYIINLGNSVKEETFSLAVEFLAMELERTAALQGKYLILHPGSHVGAGEEAGIKQIVKGINEVLDKDSKVYIALETMAGKGSEIGKTFEELAQIYDGVKNSDKLRGCVDTCHTNDAGYDIVNDFDGVIDRFDKLIGKDQIAVFHINDSKNVRGAAKDRHENIGFGNIGFDAIHHIVHHKDFENVPKILETPYVSIPGDSKKSLSPYKYEIDMLRKGVFNANLLEDVTKTN